MNCGGFAAEASFGVARVIVGGALLAGATEAIYGSASGAIGPFAGGVALGVATLSLGLRRARKRRDNTPTHINAESG